MLFAQSCLPGVTDFTTQAQIDSFQVNYPGCTEIEGSVNIVGDDISNLIGLNVLTSIGGRIVISEIPVLTSLTGLEGLISIEWDLGITSTDSLNSFTGLVNLTSIGGGIHLNQNQSLTNFTGLEGLTSIGDGIFIGYNHSLTSLTGLENVSTFGGKLKIYNNDALTNLTGLDNIEAGSISELYIYNNNSLSNCEVEIVCDYLASPNGTVEIHNNDNGCNSQQEVEDACDSIQTFVIEFSHQERFIISPNPISSVSEIAYTIEQRTPVILQILDLSGQVVTTLVNEQQQQGEQRIAFDGSQLKPGVYFCMLKTNNGILTKKIIKL